MRMQLGIDRPLKSAGTLLRFRDPSAEVLDPILNDSLKLLRSAKVGSLKGADAAGHLLFDACFLLDELGKPFQLRFASPRTA